MIVTPDMPGAQHVTVVEDERPINMVVRVDTDRKIVEILQHDEHNRIKGGYGSMGEFIPETLELDATGFTILGLNLIDPEMPEEIIL